MSVFKVVVNELNKLQSVIIEEIQTIVDNIQMEIRKLDIDPHYKIWDEDCDIYALRALNLNHHVTETETVFEFSGTNYDGYPIEFNLRIPDYWSDMTPEEIALDIEKKSKELFREEREMEIKRLKEELTRLEQLNYQEMIMNIYG